VSLVYRIMYRVGFTPWDNEKVPAELTALVEGREPSRALDLGCGTGTQAVYMAKAGWQVTGLDAVKQPLARARDRARAAGVEVDWIEGDVAKLTELGIEPGVDLFHDRGCYHGLPDVARTAYATGVTGLAAPGATLLMMAFAPNRVLVGPSGASESEIRERFASGWEVQAAAADRGPGPPGPMRNVPRFTYRLVRNQP
jgi:SAM-dependent methyltransferase